MLAGLLLTAPAYAQRAGSLPEQANDIAYPSPQAAEAALRTKPGVVMSQANGWTIATEAAAQTYWAFPPATDPAYPAVVRRRVLMRGTGVFIDMAVLCGGSKLGCDQMVLDFGKLNDQLRERLSHAPGAIPPGVPAAR